MRNCNTCIYYDNRGFCTVHYTIPGGCDDYSPNRAEKDLIELQEYRKLGTVEEVREAVEKAKAKKPKTRHLKKYDGYNDGWCPCCGTYVQEFEYDKKYCQNCGQKLDWSVEE